MKSERKKLILSEADKFIKQNTLQWKKKIYRPKFVWFVKDPLNGERNGSWVGIKSNIVQKGVLIKKSKYEFKKNNNFINFNYTKYC